MDESVDKTEAAIARGHRADALLADPVLVAAFDGYRAALLQLWQETKAQEKDGRETIWLAINLVDKVKAGLLEMAANGRLSQRHLDMLAGRKK